MTEYKVGKVCLDCQHAFEKKHHGGFDFKCYYCRQRLLLSEPCKLMRDTLAKMLRKWGETPEYKIEPHCGCEKSCKRRQYQKQG
jgi:hypothetical protein